MRTRSRPAASRSRSSTTSAGLRKADKIVLPGVGHYGQMLRSLDAPRRARNAARADRLGNAVPGHLPWLPGPVRTSEESPRAGACRISGPSDPLPGGHARAADGLELAAKTGQPRVCSTASETSLTSIRQQLLRPARYGRRARRRVVRLRGNDLLRRAGRRQRFRRPVPPGKIGACRPTDPRQFPGMLTKRIIPCLDVKAGRVVKGVNFVGLRDAGDPVELSERYNRDGADELVFLDITASSDPPRHHDRRRRAGPRARSLSRSPSGEASAHSDARKILTAGADKVSVNTAAVERPELLTELSNEFGAQATVIAPRTPAVPARPAGTFSPTAAAATPASTPWSGPRKPRPGARAKSCSPRWTRTGRSAVSIASSRGPSPRRRRFPSSPAAGEGSPATSSRC